MALVLSCAMSLKKPWYTLPLFKAAYELMEWDDLLLLGCDSKHFRTETGRPAAHLDESPMLEIRNTASPAWWTVEKSATMP